MKLSKCQEIVAHDTHRFKVVIAGRRQIWQNFLIDKRTMLPRKDAR